MPPALPSSSHLWSSNVGAYERREAQARRIAQTRHYPHRRAGRLCEARCQMLRYPQQTRIVELALGVAGAHVFNKSGHDVNGGLIGVRQFAPKFPLLVEFFCGLTETARLQFKHGVAMLVGKT